jgi:hypothetical protein
MSHGINVTASYTFGKVLDYADAWSGQVDPFLSPRARNYGPANFDRRQVFTSNFYWTLPKPGKYVGFRAVHWIADNWELAGVVRMMTGAPFTPGYSLVNGVVSPTGSPSEAARVQVIDPAAPPAQRFGPPPQPAGQGDVPWAVSSTAPQLGNLGKNTLRGPGTNNWDLSIYRRIHITDRVMGQLRLESYNTFNHTQFANVNSTLIFNTAGAQTNPAFEHPTTARPPRRVQLAIRLSF